MRTSITVGRAHGGKALEVIHGAEVPITEQLANFKELQRSGEHPHLEHAELWTSDRGRIKEHKMLPPSKAKHAPKPGHAAPHEAAPAAHHGLGHDHAKPPHSKSK